MTEVLMLAFLGALAWLWWDSMQSREAAVSAARAACAAQGLLFLDDTVGIAGIRPARDHNGRLQLQRRYDFEYSDTGANRVMGSIVMLGCRVLDLQLQPRPPATVHTIP